MKKYIIFNPDYQMYYAHYRNRRLMYTNEIESTVHYESKEFAQSVIDDVHLGYDADKMQRHNLIIIIKS